MQDIVDLSVLLYTMHYVYVIWTLYFMDIVYGPCKLQMTSNTFKKTEKKKTMGEWLQ